MKAVSYKSAGGSAPLSTEWQSVAQAGEAGGVAGAIVQGLNNLAGHYLRKGQIAEDQQSYQNGLEQGEKAALEMFGSGGALVLRDDDSIESQAFNQRALDVFTSRLDMTVNERLDNLARQHKHDPQAYRDAANAIIPGIVSRLPENQRENASLVLETQTSRKFADLRDEFERQSTASYLARLDLNIQTQLTDVELAASDPGQFEDAARKIKAKILPEVPEQLREQVEIEFDAAVLAGSRRVTRDYQAKVEDANNADLLTKAETAARAADNAWRSGDFDAARIEEAKLTTALDARTDLTAERKAALTIERQDQRTAQITFGEFERFHSGDVDRAKQFIAEFRATDHEGLGPELKSRLSNQMESMTADIKAERKLAVSDLRDDARVAIDAVSKGRTFEGWEDLRARAVDLNDAETLAELDDAAAIMAEAQTFAVLPPAEQKERIETLRGAVSNATDNARIDVLEKVAAASAKQLQTDPVGFAVEKRLSGFAPIDVTDLAGSMAARAEARRKFEARMGVAVPDLLTEKESEQIITTIDQLPSPERAAILAQMVGGSGKDAPRLLAQIAPKKPEYAHAAAIFAENPVVASDIMLGVEIGQLEKQYVPKPSKWQESYNTAIPHGAFDAVSTQDRAGIEATVKALYTKFARDAADTSGDVDSDALSRAIEAVTGGLVEYDAYNFQGGTDSYRTVSPVRGMSDEDFTSLIDGLTEQDLGSLPRNIEGDPVDIDDVRRYGKFVFAGSGRYFIQFNQTDLAVDENGNPFVVDLAAIAKGAG